MFRKMRRGKQLLSMEDTVAAIDRCFQNNNALIQSGVRMSFEEDYVKKHSRKIGIHSLVEFIIRGGHV